MTETQPALSADLALSDDTGTNVAQVVPSGCNDDRPKSDLWGKEALEITPPTSEIAATRRGRGRPAGASLRVLLTQRFPDGATAEMLIAAGFGGDLSAALKRGNIKEQGSRFVWIGVSRGERTQVSELRVSSNPPTVLPPVPDPDLGRLNKEKPLTERFRIEEIPPDKIKIGRGGAF